MITRIKVCGITRTDDALAAVDLGADAIGFIFYSGSPRAASQDVAREVVRQVPAFVTTVGVFVNAERQTIREIVEETGIRAVQLHGDEPDALIRSLPYPVIRAVRPRPGSVAGSLQRFPRMTFLVDAFETGKYGGTGKLSDWNFALQAKRAGPVILSGGLNPENVAGAIHAVRPYGVDVSSGVEREPGRKDRTKMARFIAAVHDANATLPPETSLIDNQIASLKK